MDKQQITFTMASLLPKFEALGIEIPMTVHQYLMAAYLDEVAHNKIKL